jgi:hypothetical protein
MILTIFRASMSELNTSLRADGLNEGDGERQYVHAKFLSFPFFFLRSGHRDCTPRD